LAAVGRPHLGWSSFVETAANDLDKLDHPPGSITRHARSLVAPADRPRFRMVELVETAARDLDKLDHP